jgi:putative acetyltransferase
LLNAYLPNLKVVIARDDAGVIHGFLGVDENRIEMLFVDDASRGRASGNCCCNTPSQRSARTKWM